MKMTYKAAYIYFKDYFGETHCAMKDCIHCDAVRQMFMAIKKQLPKKVEKNEDDFKVCPNCKSIAIKDYTTGIKFKYCSECGQAIDWGKENDKN
jgi:uncharacterized protein with PIN domain